MPKIVLITIQGMDGQGVQIDYDANNVFDIGPEWTPLSVRLCFLGQETAGISVNPGRRR